MIYTVTFNPSIDYIVRMPRLEPGAINRVTYEDILPGGKGINVSKVIAKLGGDSRAVGILGGESGRTLEKLLENENFTTQFRFVEGQTRTNIKIIDRVGHTNTDINEPGLTVTDADLDALLNDLLAEVHAGDIVVLAGIEDVTIGDTICTRESPRALPRIRVDEPTVAMRFGINTSPLAGREGKIVQSRAIQDRLVKESLRNVAIRVEETADRDAFLVKGRGEFQMAILIETMRREGFELSVGRPEVILKKDANGKPGPFADFVHAASKVPVIKMQHPDFETFQDGPHGAAGVSCADCHMPYQRVDGKKMSSHWMTSPMKDKEMRACRQCHADKTPEYLRQRVIYTQQKTFDQLLKAEALSVKAHEAVRLANSYDGERAADYDALMTEAREMVRKGQLFWDYVSAENSVGFHNPAKALDTLMTSMECSQKAVDLAGQATHYGIAPALAGDIEKIVPPILEMSRKLQQDPEFLQKNPWTKLLPVLPKADQVWDGQERLTSTK